MYAAGTAYTGNREDSYSSRAQTLDAHHAESLNAMRVFFMIRVDKKIGLLMGLGFLFCGFVALLRPNKLVVMHIPSTDLELSPLVCL